MQSGIGVHFNCMKLKPTITQNDVDISDTMHKKAFATVFKNFAHRVGHCDLFRCIIT